MWLMQLRSWSFNKIGTYGQWLSYSSIQQETYMPQDLYARMFISALFETDKTKITQMSINKKTDEL